jgi:hypothetical protein
MTKGQDERERLNGRLATGSREARQPRAYTLAPTPPQPAPRAPGRAPRLPQLLRALARKRAGRVHKGEDGEAKLVGVVHEAQRLAVAVGLRHAEVAVDVLLRRAPAAGSGSASRLVTIKSRRSADTACTTTPWCGRDWQARALRAFVLRPFWWPMSMKDMPSMEPRPQTMAGSSRPARSPCSSTNLSVMLSAMSRNVGRLACRATCSRCVAVRRSYVSLRSCRGAPHGAVRRRG